MAVLINKTERKVDPAFLILPLKYFFLSIFPLCSQQNNVRSETLSLPLS